MTQLTRNYDPVVLHEAIANCHIPEYSYSENDVRQWQTMLRGKLFQLLGLHRMPAERVPLNVQYHWQRETALGTISRLVFCSERGYDVQAYFCLPHMCRRNYPVFICLQGHSTGMHNSIAVAKEDESSAISVDGDRDFGLSCMRYGVAALCIDQRGFGYAEDQRKDTPDRCHNAAVQALMLGRTLLGERIYDVDRAIDLLYAVYPEVDRARIGVMGNSGGGTTSMFAGALLDRITHVMPSCSFSSFRASIIRMYHCVCNYVPDLLCYAEAADVLGVCAPKPLVIVSGKNDPIFPIAEARAEFARLQVIYADAHAANNCRHIIGQDGHRFYADKAWSAMLEYLKYGHNLCMADGVGYSPPCG